jgi:hypothetical protein
MFSSLINSVVAVLFAIGTFTAVYLEKSDGQTPTPTPNPVRSLEQITADTPEIHIGDSVVDQTNREFSQVSVVPVDLPDPRGVVQVQEVSNAPPGGKHYYYFPLAYVDLASLRNGDTLFGRAPKTDSSTTEKTVAVPIRTFFDDWTA